MELKKKIILHIDYDSFFASVEQQANPSLRGKPIAVTGGTLKRGVACTASKEAKEKGVKTGMPLFEVRRLCPDIIFVQGDFKKYRYVQEESLKIFEKFTDLVEPFSIDEAFLDVTKTVRFFQSPENIAKEIKTQIAQKFGEYVTCSIGIGSNKLMAKLVSDFNKPDGLYIVDDDNLERVLRTTRLRDFCGIGPRILSHLNRIGIYTVEDLQQTSLNSLYREFGNVTGSFLNNASKGIHLDDVKSVEYYRRPKSIGHQHTLSEDTKDPRILLGNIRTLTEMVVARMRRQGMVGCVISLTLRDKNRKWCTDRLRLYKHVDSSIEIFKALEILFCRMAWTKEKREIRLVGVTVTDLVTKSTQAIPLFGIEEKIDKKSEELLDVVDKINNRWGEFTIHPASVMFGDTTKNKLSSFLRYE